MSTEESGVMSSEDSSSPVEAELELGLGLGLVGVSSSGGFGFNGQQALKGHPYARILTAQDFPFVVSASSSSSSTTTTTSSSSSTLSRASANGTAGTKRTAESVTSPNATTGPVVGWPPLRAYRINSMVNQGKSLTSEDFNSTTQKNNSMNMMVDKTRKVSNTDKANFKVGTSLFVKVNMDGIPIGRKVDLNAHGCYENLAKALEDMFLRAPATTNATRSRSPEHNIMVDASNCSRLLNGSSEFVLTYEDKEGDWMLVGDVPWSMFLSSVKRLRIVRTCEATGLGKQM